MSSSGLPPDVEYVRTTPTFTESTVPAGLLGEHRVAEATWAVLTVYSGSLTFVFDESVPQPGNEPGGVDEPTPRRLDEGASQVIPPRRLHHLELNGEVSFDVAFYRLPPGQA